jgi:3'(2'), 5'-bisphosphate nucleotidase
MTGDAGFAGLLLAAVGAAKKAGDAILEVYNSDFAVELKDDKSPLTLADKRAHEIISRELSRLAYPILSEEGKNIPYEERKDWEYFWLVDPLDGTKEFVKRNGEFTVNIALIHNTRPVLGVVYVPVKAVLYYAAEGIGAYKLEGGDGPDSAASLDALVAKSRKLPIADGPKRRFTVVASRSHMSRETEDHLNELKKEHGEVDVISAGSSLKFCLVAEGLADEYPRFGPTMEWDTAAGHALVEQANGVILEINTTNPLRYNKESLLNPWFTVNGSANKKS